MQAKQHSVALPECSQGHGERTDLLESTGDFLLSIFNLKKNIKTKEVSSDVKYDIVNVMINSKKRMCNWFVAFG